MEELFLGTIINKLFNISFDYLKDQYRWQTGMKKELERLQSNHLMIQAVVFAANQADIRDQNTALNNWIWRLRDVIDEADDLFDDFEYIRLEKQLSTNMRSIKSLISTTSHQLRKVGKRALKIDSNLKRLEEVVQKLNRVSAEVTPFLYLIENTNQEQQKDMVELQKICETGSSPTTDEFLGRGNPKNFIIEWLREPSNEEHQTHVSTTNMYDNISLLSIVGHGGMGKTTLLQHVYKDEMTIEFDLKMWVCVSNNFDVKKVIAGMLESLKKIDKDLETLEALQSKLNSEVKYKKFILVLDDIWEENEEIDKRKWQKVMAPLAHGRLGSKILISTRMDSVASMFAKVIKKKKNVLKLKGLQENDCLQLLTTHAFAGVENPNDYKKLRSIARELVKKLFGSPLAAKVMGGFLNSNLDETHWRKALNNKFGQNDIVPILKLSYMYLPKHLQNCFAFCSIFPQNFAFNKHDLVRMWIAVGFVQPSSIQEETLEEIGERYFDVLAKKSFFDEYTQYYKMHDLLLELAQFVSTQECFRDEGDEKLLSKVPETIRHLSIKLCNLKVLKNGRFKNLRTLIITYNADYKDYIDIDTFNEVFKVTRSIRLLDIQVKRLFDVIPEGIGYLKHLRYLGYDFKVKLLPRSLTKLFHLQFILCDDSSYCDFYPREMNNLSNLRYVNHPRFKFSGIRKLKFLQSLENFNVENENGYRIEELKHMNDLHLLGINQLENVRDAKEACNANLCNKKKLEGLSLNWCEDNYNRQKIVNPELDERVFDKLQPHNYLKGLYISNYMGFKSAIWMKDPHVINNLEEIELSNCLNWQILPPFGHLPFLKILKLANMPKAKRLDNKSPENDEHCNFPSLEKLKISKLEALEDWFDARVDCLFPRLTKLKLYNCPNLQELPYLHSKLVTLKLKNMEWKSLNCTITELRKVKIIDCPNLITVGKQQVKIIPTELEYLIINDPSVLQTELLGNVVSMFKMSVQRNDELISFSSEAERWFLQVCSSVLEMHFWNLQSLQSLPYSLTNFSSLQHLMLGDLPQLQELQVIPANVEQLDLCELKSLQRLPSSLSAISSLKNIELIDIPLLKSLPDLPRSLLTLHLESLDNLECLPSCLPSLSSLRKLSIIKVPLLRELPNLPQSLKYLKITECYPELIKRYKHFSGAH